MAASKTASRKRQSNVAPSSASRCQRSPRAEALARELACGLGRRDETPNIELGQKLARQADADAVGALVELLDEREAASDAIKALYECGYVAPGLLVPHAERFVALLTSRKNRLVWGGMIALSCVARAAPEVLWPHKAKIMQAFENGSVITRDAAIVALAAAARSNPSRARSLTPWFVTVLEQARPKELPQWTDEIVPALGSKAILEILPLLQRRLAEVSAPSARRKLERMLARTEARARA